MTDRPILFSGPMVRALLDGRKTQTRRVLKPPYGTLEYLPDGTWKPIYTKSFTGDRLWVREAWRIGAWHYNNAEIAIDYCDGPQKEWLYVDDSGDLLHRLIDQSRTDAEQAGRPLRDSYYEYSWSPGDSPCRWRPSIHMPRWASRLTLAVTDVRVQRVQDISRGDAMEEGCPFANMAAGPNPRDWFSELWDSLNAKRGYGWDANPWVVAITFDVHRCNIDQMEREQATTDA